jgi:ABC-type Fe3+/spermidine/putrescine transport system ATPase subunit
MEAKGVTAVDVRSVSKRFGRTVALEEVSFELHPGEPAVIVGPSGSVKTTLLRLIAGLETPDAGEVYLDGTPCGKLRPHERGIGFVFQSPALWPHMTVAENIGFGVRGDRVRVEELLQHVGLPEYGSRYPDELSGGEVQRVALARALAPRARLLLLDEPLSHLDDDLRWRMLDLILSAARDTGATLLYVAHDVEEASRVSPRTLRLLAGRLSGG